MRLEFLFGKSSGQIIIIMLLWPFFRCGKALNVTEASTLIELLLNADRMGEAMAITEEMLEKSIYPLPKIFR